MNEQTRDRTYYKPETQTISILGPHGFIDIDLRQCSSPAELLSFMLWLRSCSWCTGQTLLDFLDVLEEACRKRFGKSANFVYCEAWKQRLVDWDTGKAGVQE